MNADPFIEFSLDTGFGAGIVFVGLFEFLPPTMPPLAWRLSLIGIGVLIFALAAVHLWRRLRETQEG